MVAALRRVRFALRSPRLLHIPGVSAVSMNTKSNEHLITLRDYDFVGEDPRLAAALAERMALLQSPVEPPPPDPGRRRVPSLPDVRHMPAYRPKPDFLRSNLSVPQMVNVSLDYAEMFNVSELISEANEWPPAAPGAGLRGPPPPGAGLRGPPSPGAAPHSEPTPATETPGPTNGSSAAQFPDGRRQTYHDPTWLNNNHKILDLMRQAIYGSQRKILELDTVIKMYESDPRFRMAYIFNRLDEWMHDLRTVYYSMKVWRYWPRRVKRLIWYYEHSLRLNIDITYSIEHLVFLHSEYMKNMEAILPLKKRQEMREQKSKLNEKINTPPPSPPPSASS